MNRGDTHEQSGDSRRTGGGEGDTTSADRRTDAVPTDTFDVQEWTTPRAADDHQVPRSDDCGRSAEQRMGRRQPRKRHDEGPGAGRSPFQ